MNSNSSQEARAGVAERWIASHAGGGGGSNSLTHSNGSSPRSSLSASPESANNTVWVTGGAPPSAVTNGSPRYTIPSATYQGFMQSKGPPPSVPSKQLATFSQYSSIPTISEKQLLPNSDNDCGPANSIQNVGYDRFNHAQPLPYCQPNGTSGLCAPVDELPQKYSPGSPRAYYLSFGNEKLYEAYNDLHSLAQNFHKPFDAPAILVVGHQTDGKSALVEALMGFQFNHVGGGTKTRRPITLHMKYNADCLEPVCYLMTDDKPPIEEEKSLEDLQAFIEAENMRLEQEACQFWAKEIVVKIEYKFCPNLTIIDTPGLIAAAPGRKNHLLQAQARAVEALVRTKMQQKEFIILCLEDCSDWSNATTRRVVMQMDPELSRTVIVSTKLDTKIPQFARAADVELFLKPPPRLLDGNILGATPFFTSVPSGRVGISRDSVFRSNEQFREAVALREAQDLAALEEKMDRHLLPDERARVGVSKLRWFLEQLLQQRYMESVPLIVPLLDREHRNASRRLLQLNQELGDLDEAKLKEKGRLFRDSFLAKLSLLLKGTVVAPPEKFGETLQDERTNGGAFVGTDGLQIPFKHMPNAGMRLYGGAQYHRAMAEYRLVVGNIKCPSISREEIVNACGVEDIHDGTNYFRTSCVIAVTKARDIFEPFLYQLGYRLSHILRRLLPIALYLLQKDGEYLSGHNMFMKRVSDAFHAFVESTERACREKCMEDLMSTTRYVTWSLHTKNRIGLRQFLDTYSTNEGSPLSATGAINGALSDSTVGTVGSGNKQENKQRQDSKINSGAPNSESVSPQTPQARLVDLLESTLWNRRLAPSSEEIVNALVAQIFDGIRDHFVMAAELKFNCFFLMPVVDKFPALLREDLEAAFEEDLDNVFEVAQARRALEVQKSDIELELKRVEKLKEKFTSVQNSLNRRSNASLEKGEFLEDSVDPKSWKFPA
ncbi:hypothetical protein KP509_08G030700 [Ceratopteris richardii]|uniref:Dynamin-type G domain-containing protein n=1 Tax=Ceratopteris richardii TaxID=49495 RepID=A0A8T2UF95_CERRI|nr:hypothetical protein KP509_08G030700 [Ceratopteris richardii]